jgi:hypothetical protein
MDKEIEETTTSEETVEEEATSTEDEQPSELDELRNKNRQMFERTKEAEIKAKELKAQKEELEAKLASTDEDDYLETDDKVASQVAELSAQLASMKEQTQLDVIYAKYPVLKDKIEEFDTFKQDYPTDKLETAAKIFLTENDLLTEEAPRKGLEPAKGGNRVPPRGGKMSSEDIQRLRENNWEEYRKKVKSGEISVES